MFVLVAPAPTQVSQAGSCERPQRIIEALVGDEILWVDIGVVEHNELAVAERAASCTILSQQGVMQHGWLDSRHSCKLTCDCPGAAPWGLHHGKDSLACVCTDHVRIVCCLGSHSIASRHTT